MTYKKSFQVLGLDLIFFTFSGWLVFLYEFSTQLNPIVKAKVINANITITSALSIKRLGSDSSPSAGKIN